MVIDFSCNSAGSGMYLRTPGQYSMGVAECRLLDLNRHPEVFPKDTGWSRGFGLEVAAWIPIHARNVAAELMTDGEETWIRPVSGPYVDFEWLLELVTETVERCQQGPDL